MNKQANLTKGKKFEKGANCKRGLSSPMSNSARTDLKSDCTVLKLHDMCGKSDCKCRKQLTCSTNQYMLEDNGFKNKMAKICQRTKKSIGFAS